MPYPLIRAILVLSLLGIVVPVQPAAAAPLELAQRRPRRAEDYLNPLDIPPHTDPLLPDRLRQTTPPRRPAPLPPLEPGEQAQLARDLVDLATEAQRAFEQDQKERAYELWFRELRLRRLLGPIAEVEALARVGGMAWEENRNQDVAAISSRLEAIEAAASSEDLALIRALGQAYRQVRLYPNAVAMYERQLATLPPNALNQRSPLLKVVAELHRDWFQFERAIGVYQELLTMARSQFDLDNVQNYLGELAHLYDQTEQWQEAIATRETLLLAYGEKQRIERFAPLRMAMAANALALGNGEQASEFYQQAFTFAWAAQQYAYAGDALEALAQLYSDYGQVEEAINLYRERIKAAQYAYDRYAVMETYNRLAQLHRRQGNYTAALNALRSGREVALELGHREGYFEEAMELLIQEQFERLDR
ncbi:MAG: tetratricopeptide repeat protein [Spirulina sp. DLM2.Bin59]|nr:MAG: tetratricopeptide repeat protein [Spirulina sp. DLM2.Bin59]